MSYVNRLSENSKSEEFNIDTRELMTQRYAKMPTLGPSVNTANALPIKQAEPE